MRSGEKMNEVQFLIPNSHTEGYPRQTGPQSLERVLQFRPLFREVRTQHVLQFCPLFREARPQHVLQFCPLFREARTQHARSTVLPPLQRSKNAARSTVLPPLQRSKNAAVRGPREQHGGSPETTTLIHTIGLTIKF